MKIKALIKQYNGGKYGSSCEYIAIVDAQTKKNGEIYKTKFDVLEVVETKKKGYRANCNAVQSESIVKILEIME